MANRIVPVLMCGGIGTRLWPLSRTEEPKQFQALASDNSMLSDTIARFSGPDFATPILLGNAAHLNLMQAELAKHGLQAGQILIEPVVRSTAPAIAAAAVLVAETDPDTLMLVAPSDHVVGQPDLLRAAALAASVDARLGRMVLFGITPTHPETGFGYIRAGNAIEAGRGGNALEPQVLAVAQFIEKPNETRAKQLIAAGDCFWNSGMFLFTARTILAELALHAPDVLKAAEAAVHAGRRERTALFLDPQAFSASDSISIDHAVMEKSGRSAVIPVSPEWSDVGSWDAIYDMGAKSPDGNVLRGDTVVIGANNNLVMASGRLVTLLGVNDLVVVDTPDALLIAARGQSQDVKKIAGQLTLDQRAEAHRHTVSRAGWGTTEDVVSTDGARVRHLKLKSLGQLVLTPVVAARLVILAGSGRISAGTVEEPALPGRSIECAAGQQLSIEAGKAGLQLLQIEILPVRAASEPEHAGVSLPVRARFA